MRSWAPEAREEAGPLKPGEIFAGKYEVRAQLGRGGFGSVYLATHTLIGWECALKVLYRSTGVTQDLLERGKKEARILVDVLNHPHIVDVKDVGIGERGLFYMAMEYLPGRTLRDVLLEHRRLAIVETLAYFAQVAEAIHVAHEAGIVHRDLKPENLFVLPGNEPKVLDFGIAKLLDPSDWKTLPNVVMGTVKYLTPEQLMDRSVSPKNDIYTLGEVMFECLAGEHWCWIVRPDLAHPIEMPVIKMHYHPPRLDELGLGIPSYVADLVQRAMLRRPEQRFASAQEFADEMRACIVSYEEELTRKGHVPLCRELWHVPPVDTAMTDPQGVLFSEGGSVIDDGGATARDRQPSFAPPAEVTRPDAPISLRARAQAGPSEISRAAPSPTIEPRSAGAPAAARPIPWPGVRQDAPVFAITAPARRRLPPRLTTVLVQLRGALHSVQKSVQAWARRQPWSPAMVLSGSAFGASLAFLIIVVVWEPALNRDAPGERELPQPDVGAATSPSVQAREAAGNVVEAPPTPPTSPISPAAEEVEAQAAAQDPVEAKPEEPTVTAVIAAPSPARALVSAPPEPRPRPQATPKPTSKPKTVARDAQRPPPRLQKPEPAQSKASPKAKKEGRPIIEPWIRPRP